jgi:NADPH:quinone reductase-like Zn-dependent oxidoreductase
MRALAIQSKSGIEAAQVMEVADPVCGPDDVVVRVRAAAFNHLDLWTVNGELPFEIDFPSSWGPMVLERSR